MGEEKASVSNNWRNRHWRLRLAVPVPPEHLTTYEDIRTFMFMVGHAPHSVLEYAAEKFYQERNRAINSGLMGVASAQIMRVTNLWKWGRSTISNWRSRFSRGNHREQAESVGTKEKLSLGGD